MIEYKYIMFDTSGYKHPSNVMYAVQQVYAIYCDGEKEKLWTTRNEHLRRKLT